MSNVGWIGFSRTPHTDAVFEGELTVDGQLVEVVWHLPLVGQQPVHRRLVPHRLADRLRRGFAVGAEQDLRIVLRLDDRRVEPDRDDDPRVVGLLLGDVAGPHRVEHAVGDGGLPTGRRRARTTL